MFVFLYSFSTRKDENIIIFAYVTNYKENSHPFISTMQLRDLVSIRFNNLFEQMIQIILIHIQNISIYQQREILVWV